MKENRRCLLHRNQLENFKSFLVFDGWKIEKTTGYEIIRAKKDKKFFVAYDRLSGDHLTVQENMQYIVKAFIKSKRLTNP